MRFLPPVLTIMLCVSAVSTAPGAPAPAAPAIARDSAADSTRISAAQSLDTVPRLVKLTGTFVGFDLLSNSIIIENARQLYDTLVLSQNAVVSCADAIGALGDIKAGNALTLACRKYRGNRTVLSIRKKGCATGEPPPPTSMQPASTPVPAETHR